jgi:antitoxin MazE
VKSSIVRIGNSRGIRIPKTLLDQCRLGKAVELEAHPDHLVIRSAVNQRHGWDEALRAIARPGDDALLDRDSLRPTRSDRTEWRW